MTGKTEWTTADPSLHDSTAAHETRAVMRMHRAGWPGAEVMKTLNYRGAKLMNELTAALDEEGDAHRLGQHIHDVMVPRGTV